MKRINIAIISRLVLGTVLLTGSVACTTYYRDGPPVYTSAYYHHPYHYHYYPSTRVYYHISSGYYYYPEGDHWNRARNLPSSHHLDRRDRVRLWTDADKPYSSNSDHRQKYRPDRNFKHDNKRDPEERRDNQRLHERYRNR